MSDNTDDGCLWFGILAAAGGIWWAATHYTITEKAKAPAIPAPAPSGITAIDVAGDSPTIRPIGRVEILKLDDKAVWYLDADSVKGPRSARLAWRVEDRTKVAKANKAEGKVLYRFNCDTGGYQTLQAVDYNKAGSVLRTWREDQLKNESGYVIPESNLELVMRASCLPGYGP